MLEIYRKINKTITQVGFWDECEQYYVVGDVGKEEAMKAFILYEWFEAGLTVDDGFSQDPPTWMQDIKLGYITEKDGWMEFHEEDKEGSKAGATLGL